MQRLRLTHPRLDFWIDVRLREFDGRWIAVADLANQPEIGLAPTHGGALWRALSSFPIVLRHDLVAAAEHQLPEA